MLYYAVDVYIFGDEWCGISGISPFPIINPTFAFFLASFLITVGAISHAVALYFFLLFINV